MTPPTIPGCLDLDSCVSVDELRGHLEHQLAALLEIPHARLEFAMLSRPTVADGTTVVAVGGAASRLSVVVLCSAPGYEDAVAAGMNRARAAKAALGASAGKPILDTLSEGRVRGMSYAILPYCEQLSDKRPYWWLQRAALKPVLLDWLRQVEQRTACAVDTSQASEHFTAPLRRITTLPDVSDGLRSAAVEALARLESGAWRPRHALMHGDLWKDNVLLKPRHGSIAWTPRADHFAVIDWGGSQIKGYGIFDLVRLAQSLRLRGEALHREVAHHCQILSCDLADARSHLLAALGHFAMQPGCLPIDRYARMADSCLLTLEQATHPGR